MGKEMQVKSVGGIAIVDKWQLTEIKGRCN